MPTPTTIRNLTIAGALILTAIFIWQSFKPSPNGTARVAVTIPDLTAEANTGKKVFDANCATCHGQNAAGSDRGPPLIHVIYNPGHHADEAFYFAAKNGVRSHHWRFGDMPAQPQVSDADIAAIVAYVREIQRANGITMQPHRM